MRKEVDVWRTQLRKGTLELAVLLLLRDQRRYGLELVDLLNTEVELGVSEGSIYPLLARLRAEKKVTSQWIDNDVGHAHKYYSLTERGRAACRVMVSAWREYVSDFDKLLKRVR